MVTISFMKTIEVGCAVIFKEGMLLIAQRKLDDSLGGYWEFPGGKRHDHESLEECLIREVQEELGVEVKPRQFLRRTEHKYPDRHLVLYFYLCDWVSGHPVTHDCHDFRWIEPKDLRQFQFPPADEDIIKDLIDNSAGYC